MARVLSSITFNAPSAPVSVNVGATFTFTGTPVLSGSGSVQRYDFKFEVDSGGGFAPIGSSGTGLTTAGTNPITNANSSAQQSITVTCAQAGTYTIRMSGAPTSGGAYSVASSTQSVTVDAGVSGSAAIALPSMTASASGRLRFVGRG